MTLIGLLVLLVIIGVALWLITTYIPMDQAIKTILTVVVIIVVLLIVLQYFGLLDGSGINVRIR